MDGRQNSTAPDAAAHRPLNQQQTKLLAMVWTLVGLCVIFVSLRFYSKLSRRKRLWWDDFFLVIAALTLAVMGSLCIVTVRNGFGLHSYEVPRASWPVNFVLGNVLATMNIAGAIWSKTSWALTMLRLTTGWYKAFVWFAIVSVNVFMGFNAMILWIGCTPLEKAWNFLVPGYCWGMKIFYTWSIAIGIFSGVMDVALSLLPWKLLMGMRMHRKEMIGVAIAMSLGIFAGAASFAKAAYIPLLLEKDASYTSVRLVIWGCVEVGWCVIAASIPMLRPLLIRDADDSNDSRGRRRRPTLFSDSESQSGLPLPFMRIAGRSGSGSNLIVGGSGAMDRNGSSVAVTDRSMTLGPSSVTIDSGSQNDSTQKFTSMTTTTTVSTMSTASIDKQKQNGSQHRRYDADDGGDGEKRPSTAPDHEQTTSNTAQDRPETTTPTLHKRVASISRFREEEVDPLSPASTEPSPQPHPQQSLHSTPLSPPPQELQHQPLPQPQPSPQSSPSAAEAAVSRPATPSLRVQFRIVDFDIVGGVSGADESIRPEER